MIDLLESAEGFCGRLAALSLDHGSRVLRATLVLSIVALAVVSQTRFSGDMVALFMDESAEVRSYFDLKDRLGEREIMVAAWACADPFAPDELAAQTRAVSRIERLEGVRSALTVATAPRLQRGPRIGVEVTTWGAALSSASAPERERLVAAALEAPELRGLVGRTLDAAALVVVLDDLGSMQVDTQRELVARVREILTTTLRSTPLLSTPLLSTERGSTTPGLTSELTSELTTGSPTGSATEATRGDVQEGAVEVHLVGLPAASASAYVLARQTIFRLVPLVVLCCVGSLWLLLRSLQSALLGIALGALAALWSTAAGIVVFGVHLTVPQTAAPILVLTLALSGYVFYVQEFRQRRRRASARDAVLETWSRVGPASCLSKLTTIVSLLALALVPAPAVRGLGLVTAFGLGLSWALEFLLYPVLVQHLPAKALEYKALRRRRSLVGLALSPSRRAPRALCVALPLASVVLGTLAMRVEVETDWMRRFEEEHPYRRADAFVSRRIGGVSSIDVVVEVPAGQALRPAPVAALARFENAALKQTGVDSTLSVTTVLRRFDRLLHPEEPLSFGESADRVRQTLFFLPVAGEEALAGFVDERKSLQRVSLRTSASGLLFSSRLAGRVQELAEQHLGEIGEVEVTGLGPMLGRWLDRLHSAQLRNLVALALLLQLTLWVAFDLRTSLWGLLPNVLPVLAMIAALSVRGDHFDSDYLVVAMLGLGLAIDDSLHLLVRHRRHARRGMSRTALQRTMLEVAPALVATTSVLVIGLLPLGLSGYLSIGMFHRELGVTLITALCVDLVVLPALLRSGPAASQWSRSLGGSQRSSSRLRSSRP